MHTNKDFNTNQDNIFVKPIKWCRYIVNAGYATAVVIILAHVVWYFAARNILAISSDIYLRYYIVLPTIGLLILNAIVDYLVRSRHVPLLVKEYLSLTLFVVFSFYLSITHEIATVLLGSFVLSVFASTVFSNIKITR